MLENNHFVISSFWEIYSQLTPNEKKAYKDFVESSLFNKKNALRNIATALLKIEKGNNVFQKDTLFAHAFADKKYNKQVLHNYLVDMKKLLLQFLQIQWIKNKPALQNWMLAETYLQKGLNHPFEKMMLQNNTED
ncbi:MAG: hypothetical protein H7Y00_14050, partial [Fimbriimonadaceae bacterium]|nr:hypothetical protein [Chitinophagales bacterium]